MNQDDSIDLSRLLQEFEDEKRLIGFDLHDGIIQLLVGSLLQLDSIDLASEVRSEKTAQKMMTVRTQLSDAIEQLRNLIEELSASSIESGQLESRLNSLIQRFREHIEVIEPDLSGLQQELDPLLSGTIYQMVQEGLNNVAKHSSATWAYVKVQANAEQVEVMVIDNGTGFDGNGLQEKHFGLKSISNRATIFGGKAAFYSHLKSSFEFDRLISEAKVRFDDDQSDDDQIEGVKNRGFAFRVVMPLRKRKR